MDNRIIVTERGQEIQKSIEEDVKLEQQIALNKKQEQQQKEKNINDESQSYIQQMFYANSQLKMMESVSKKFQVVSTAKGKNAQQKIVDMFVEENNFNKKDMNPYVLHQISKMTEEVVKGNSKKINNSSSTQNLSMLNNSINNQSQFINPNDISHTHKIMQRGFLTTKSMQNNKYASAQNLATNNNQNYNQNVSNMNVSTINQSIYDDSYLIDKCNAILHCEARVDRIMKRYKKYQKVTQEIDTRVRRACDRRREFLQEENLKPPKRLEELRKENKEIADILDRSDKYEQNRRQRVLDTMKKKYQKVWSTVHVPELTEKFKQLHRMHFKQIDEEEENETSQLSMSLSKNQTKYSGI
ncbi:hypothetical protein ABPG72_009911 [Tetrahymena utriculariae]